MLKKTSRAICAAAVLAMVPGLAHSSTVFYEDAQSLFSEGPYLLMEGENTFVGIISDGMIDPLDPFLFDFVVAAGQMVTSIVVELENLFGGGFTDVTLYLWEQGVGDAFCWTHEEGTTCENDISAASPYNILLPYSPLDEGQYAFVLDNNGIIVLEPFEGNTIYGVRATFIVENVPMAPVPLAASGAFLAGSLGLLGFLGRRRKAPS